MREVWIGNYAGREFRVTVRVGRITSVEGDLSWAKGLRIRHFKRTVWKAYGDVEREADKEKCIEVSPQGGETEKEVERIGPSQEEIEQAPGEIARVVDGLQLPDPVPELRPAARPATAVLRVRLGEQRVKRGTSLKDALKMARDLGCPVHTVRKSGEVRISHPNILKRITANNRKKDAPRKLITFLNQLKTSLPS